MCVCLAEAKKDAAKAEAEEAQANKDAAKAKVRLYFQV